MKKYSIVLLLLFIFLLEGTLFRFISPDYYGKTIYFYPRFVLIMIIFISIYRDRHFALYLGMGFGVLYDIVYGDVIGIYMVGMAGVGYFSGWLTLYFQTTFALYLLNILVNLLMFEMFLYGMLNMFHLVNIAFDWSFFHILIPTVIFNLLFASLIYLPFQFILKEKE